MERRRGLGRARGNNTSFVSSYDRIQKELTRRAEISDESAEDRDIQHLRGATASSEQELCNSPNSYGQRPGEVEAAACKRRSRTTRIGKHRCAEKCRNAGCVAGARKLLVKWWFMVRRTGSDADSIVPGVGVDTPIGPVLHNGRPPLQQTAGVIIL